MSLLKVGSTIKDFKVPNEENEIKPLSDYMGKNGLIMLFYPKASTPGCTVEVNNVKDDFKKLSSLGYGVVGVSADDVKKQKNFKEKNQLPYHLLADTEKEIINACGVWGVKKMYGKEYEGIYRTTFIFDTQLKVEHVIDKVKTKEHAEQIIEVLKN